MLIVIGCLFSALGLAGAQAGIAPAAPDPQRQLLEFLQQGNVEQVKQLELKDPELLNKPIYGKPPLVYAVQSMPYTDLLLPPEMKDCEKLPGFGTPLMWTAILYNCEPVEKLLLKYNATPLPPASRTTFQKGYASRARMSELRRVVLCWQMLAQQREFVMSKAEVVWQEIAAGMQQNLNVPFDQAWKAAYGYNAALSGLKFEQIVDSSKVVAFADCTSKDRLIHSLADIDATRHNGQCLVAFVDGHIAYVPAAEVEKLVLKP